MTPSIAPTAKTWTLRFKHHRTTILLHVDPLQRLTSIRAELLKAVRQTNPEGTLNGHIIPESASEILLARPVDQNDLTSGWESLEKKDDFLGTEEEEVADRKGKGKASASSAKAKAKKEDLTECPQGVGLRDGGTLAFKFKSEVDRNEDEGIEVDEELEGDLVGVETKQEKWDVVTPSMEEIYGDERAVVGEATEGGERVTG